MSVEYYDLVSRLNDEADQCANDGAADIAALLWEAARAVEVLAATAADA